MKYYCLLAALLLTGCATWIPAAVKDLKDGTYVITTTGNSFASSKKMELKLAKRAQSVCKQQKVHYIVGPTHQWRDQKDYSTGMTISYQFMSIKIRCET